MEKTITIDYKKIFLLDADSLKKREELFKIQNEYTDQFDKNKHISKKLVSYDVIRGKLYTVLLFFPNIFLLLLVKATSNNDLGIWTLLIALVYNIGCLWHTYSGVKDLKERYEW